MLSCVKLKVIKDEQEVEWNILEDIALAMQIEAKEVEADLLMMLLPSMVGISFNTYNSCMSANEDQIGDFLAK